MRSMSASVVRQFTIAGRNATLPAVTRRPDVHASVGEQIRADLRVQRVERVVGEIAGPVSEADDVERDLREPLELRRGIDRARQTLREIEVALDHRAMPRATVRA